MKGLQEYNLREIKKEYLSRVSLQEFTTSELLGEVERREEDEVQRHKSGMLPAHRAFLSFCAEHFDLTVSQLTGPRRHQSLSDARQVSMVVGSKVFRLGGHQAARLLKRKNHTSLYHAKKALMKRPELIEEAVVLEARWKNRHNTR